ARPVEIGIAPDMRQRLPTEPVLVRAPMLRAGSASQQYSPTFPPDRAALRAASAVDTRLRVYGEAWSRFLERPLFGWGPDGFSLLRSDTRDATVRAAAHEHSLLLWAALRYGLVGVAAVLVLVLGLYRHAPQQVAALAGVMAASLFDLTFWSSGVVLSLALVAGTALKDPGTGHEVGR
ncbi:MAG TPA: hypothetical protein VFN03_00795, partial [Trueperaceae bacterium]|nr:hypothetical protein [Trueperaceae bacterium]